MDSFLQFSEKVDDTFTEHQSNIDDNNNDYKKVDKYSLRPRSLRRKSSPAIDDEDSNGTPEPQPAIHQRGGRESRRNKNNQRPPPLSKYRRKTANARERNRMREINQAFETLRRVIPQMPQCPITRASTTTATPTSTAAASNSSSANEKLTKITTLRLAMKYITSLSMTLESDRLGGSAGGGSSEDDGVGVDFDALLMSGDYGDLDGLLLESDGESLPLSESSSILASASSPSDGFPDSLAGDDFLPEPSLSPVDFGCLPSLLQGDFDGGEHALDADDFGQFLLT